MAVFSDLRTIHELDFATGSLIRPSICTKAQMVGDGRGSSSEKASNCFGSLDVRHSRHKAQRPPQNLIIVAVIVSVLCIIIYRDVMLSRFADCLCNQAQISQVVLCLDKPDNCAWWDTTIVQSSMIHILSILRDTRSRAGNARRDSSLVFGYERLKLHSANMTR